MSRAKQQAGALMLAFATKDDVALAAALREVHAHGRPVDVILALADTAADLLMQLHGDGWQEALRGALLAAAAEGEAA